MAKGARWGVGETQTGEIFSFLTALGLDCRNELSLLITLCVKKKKKKKQKQGMFGESQKPPIQL